MDSTEIIRQLQNDPALKAEMRAVLLTEELLRVPSIVATLAEAMVQHNQRLEHLEGTVNSLIDHQAAMQASINSLIDSQASMQNSLQDLIQMTTRGFATMEAGFTEMRDGFREVQNKFNEVDARIDSLDARIEGLDARTESMGERIDGLAARIESLEARIDGLDAKFTAKFDQVDSDIRDIKGDPEI